MVFMFVMYVYHCVLMSALLEEALKKYFTIQCHAEREPYLAPKLGFTSFSSDRHIERRLRGMFVKYQCRCESEFYESRLLNSQEMMSNYLPAVPSADLLWKSLFPTMQLLGSL